MNDLKEICGTCASIMAGGAIWQWLGVVEPLGKIAMYLGAAGFALSGFLIIMKAAGVMS